ncbi:MAG: sigma-54 interaction domain-containing protein [Pirellulaceae bacterium]
MSANNNQKPASLGPPIPSLIGSSPAMEAVYRLTRKVAATNSSVLLFGEAGTGKELIATAIHQLSSRKDAPFIRINCGALSETLLESELFGHVKGSFTDAVKNRTGRFEAAHTGTIFLDEINCTSLLFQVKLLRVIQQREFERVGDTNTIRVDCRVIAASNKSLWDEVDAGRFREDLYWRLNVVPIVIPPLRMRREDILPLVTHFLAYYGEENEKHLGRIHPQAQQALQDYHWPGNVRELQNYMERAIVLAEGDELTVDLLPDTVLGKGDRRSGRIRGVDLDTLVFEVVQQGVSTAAADETNLHDKVVNRVERELIVQVLQSCNNVQTKAATRLGINRNTLRTKLQDYGFEAKEEV